jgi:hypothetical protein
MRFLDIVGIYVCLALVVGAFEMTRFGAWDVGDVEGRANIGFTLFEVGNCAQIHGLSDCVGVFH